jgi:hypothetical protein
MFSPRSLSLAISRELALCAALPILGFAPAAASAQCNLSISTAKIQFEPNETIDITVNGTPGALVAVLIDTSNGPTVIPGIGVIDIGFTPGVVDIRLVIPPDGVGHITGSLPCGNPLLGVPLFAQALTFDAVTQTWCISNPISFIVLDTTGVCGSPCPAGSFNFSFEASGDLHMTFDQWPAPNDNSYGTNAVGWPNGHKFSDLTGSDKAGFQLKDPDGIVRLSFNIDYLSTWQSTAQGKTNTPSGYASLGVFGGDGSMVLGTAFVGNTTQVGIFGDTSLARNLNNVNIPGLFNSAHVQQFGSVNVLINSPPTNAAHTTYAITDPTLAGWDFHDTYFATVTKAKLNSIGFFYDTSNAANPMNWIIQPNLTALHNSPAKPCPPASGVCADSVIKRETKDKQVKITIKNSSLTVASFLNEIHLSWNQAKNGNLIQVKLDGDILWTGSQGGGFVDLLQADLVADPNKRKIDKNSSDVLYFIFKNNVEALPGSYTGHALFDTSCVVQLFQ